MGRPHDGLNVGPMKHRTLPTRKPTGGIRLREPESRKEYTMILEDGTSTIKVTVTEGVSGGSVQCTRTGVSAVVDGTGCTRLMLKDGFCFEIPYTLVCDVHTVLGRCLCPDSMAADAHVVVFADGARPGPMARTPKSPTPQ